MNVCALYRASTKTKLLMSYSVNEILTYLNGENPNEFYVTIDEDQMTANNFIIKYAKSVSLGKGCSLNVTTDSQFD